MEFVVPLGSPVKEVVGNNHGGNPVEDLAPGASEGVEDSVVGDTSEGVLTVGGQTVVDDALLLLATW
jgi:hypothetical protein